MVNTTQMAIGPWVGEFGIWLMDIVPVINGWRLKHPTANIVVSAFEGDDAYLIDRNGLTIHNEYIPVKFWQAYRARSQIFANADQSDRIPIKNEELPQYVLEIEKRLSTYDGYVKVMNIDVSDFRMLRTRTPKAYYMLSDPHNKDKPILKDTVVLIPRTPSKARTNSRSWPAEKWLEIASRLLDSGYIVYVLGIEQNYMNELNNPNLINYSNMPDGQRQRESIKIMERALCAIGDNSGGSQIPLYCGCPLIVHTIDEEKVLYFPGPGERNRNFFGTKVWFHGLTPAPSEPYADRMKNLTVDARWQDIIKCLEEAKSLTQRYERNTLIKWNL